jgi:hypothetical protein
MYTLADHLKERLIGKNIDLGTDQVDSKRTTWSVIKLSL